MKLTKIKELLLSSKWIKNTYVYNNKLCIISENESFSVPITSDDPDILIPIIEKAKKDKIKSTLSHL